MNGGSTCIECGGDGGNRRLTRRLCSGCYQRYRRTGRELPPLVAQSLTTEDRFFRKVVGDDPLGCWIWQGSKEKGGYGTLGARRRPWLAHRWAYEFLVGEIPEGLVIDHLCRTRACVNPWHMEPVTLGVNAWRGESPTIVAARQDQCLRGHSLADAKIRKSGPQKGKRDCRTCIRLRGDRARRARSVAA